MIILTVLENRIYFNHRVPNLRGDKHRARARCPLCKSTNFQALSVDYGRGLYHCFRCGAGGDAIAFERALTGCGFKEARLAVFTIIGRPPEGPTTPASRAAILRRQRADREAKTIVRFRDESVRTLRRKLSTIDRDLRRSELAWRESAESWARDLAMEVGFLLQRRASEVEAQILRIERATAENLIIAYRRLHPEKRRAA